MTNLEVKAYLADVKKLLDKSASAMKKQTAFGVEMYNVWTFLEAMDTMTTNIQAIRKTVVNEMNIKEDT